MDFTTRLLISINWKGENCNLILVIVDRYIKMIHYKLIKVTINAFVLAIVIINMVI